MGSQSGVPQPQRGRQAGDPEDPLAQDELDAGDQSPENRRADEWRKRSREQGGVHRGRNVCTPGAPAACDGGRLPDGCLQGDEEGLRQEHESHAIDALIALWAMRRCEYRMTRWQALAAARLNAPDRPSPAVYDERGDK